MLGDSLIKKNIMPDTLQNSGVGSAGAVGLLSGIGSLISYGLNKRLVENTNRQQYEYNKKLSESAFRQNMAAWNLQNMYNSPAAQVARLRAAGLNVNEMYGHGTDAPGLAGDAPNLSYGDYSPNVPAFENPVGSGINAALSLAQVKSMVSYNSAAAFKAEADAMNTMKNTEWIDREKESLLKKQSAETYLSEMAAGNYDAMTSQVRENTRKLKLEERVLQKQLPYLSESFRLANEVSSAQVSEILERTKNYPVQRAKMRTEMNLFLSQMSYLASAENLNYQDAIYHSELASEAIARIEKYGKDMQLTDKQIDAMRGQLARNWIQTGAAAFRDIGAGISGIMGIPQFNVGQAATFGGSFQEGSIPNIYHDYGTPYSFND